MDSNDLLRLYLTEEGDLIRGRFNQWFLTTARDLEFY